MSLSFGRGGLSIYSSFCQHTLIRSSLRRSQAPVRAPGHPGNCRAGAGWPRARTAPPGPAPDQPQHAQRTCLRSLPGRRRLAPPHAQTRARQRRHTPKTVKHADPGHPASSRPQVLRPHPQVPRAPTWLGANLSAIARTPGPPVARRPLPAPPRLGARRPHPRGRRC